MPVFWLIAIWDSCTESTSLTESESVSNSQLPQRISFSRKSYGMSNARCRLCNPVVYAVVYICMYIYIYMECPQLDSCLMSINDAYIYIYIYIYTYQYILYAEQWVFTPPKNGWITIPLKPDLRSVPSFLWASNPPLSRIWDFQWQRTICLDYDICIYMYICMHMYIYIYIYINICGTPLYPSPEIYLENFL